MNPHVVALCYNPKEYLPVDVVSTGDVKTASVVVQFNIDQEAKGGAIFVDKANNGVCKFSLPTGKHVVGVPQWRPHSTHSEDPPGAYGKLKVTPSVSPPNGDDQVVTYEVARGGTSQPSTVMINFIIDFA